MQPLFDLTRFDGEATADVLKHIGPELGFREKWRQPVVSLARLLYIDGCPLLDEKIQEKIEPVWCQIEFMQRGILCRMRMGREIYALAIPFEEIRAISLIPDDKSLDHEQALKGMNWLTKPGIFFNPNDEMGWSRIILRYAQNDLLHFKFQKGGFKRARKFLSQSPLGSHLRPD